MKPVLLAITFLSEEHRAQLARSCERIYAPDAAQRAAAIAAHGATVQTVRTICGRAHGVAGVRATFLGMETSPWI